MKLMSEITHDLKIADHADKIYKMDNGVLTLYKDKDGYKRHSFESEVNEGKEAFS